MPRNKFIVPLKKETSQKACDKIQEIAYLAHIKKFGQPASYRLEQQDNEIFLIPNHIKSDLSNSKRPDNESYIFVIIQGINGAPELKIGYGSHYYLANKADAVYLAGEILFSNNQIININNQSGAYHIDMGKAEPDWQKEYLNNIKEILSQVNLPIEKFELFRKTESINQNNFFAEKKLMIGLSTAALAAVMVSYSLTL